MTTETRLPFVLRGASGSNVLALPVDDRQLLDAIPAMIWVKDRQSRVLRCNLAAAESSGKPVEEIEGRTTQELHPEEGAHYVEDDLEVIESGRGKLGIVEELTTASGCKRWVKTDKVPLHGPAGEVLGVLVFSVDITDLKRTEETLRSAERILSVGTLAASVAHEINNPLAYVTLNLLQLQRGLAELTADADKREPLERLIVETRDGIERVRLIVGDLKTFSRATDEPRRPVEIWPTLDAAVRMAQSETRQRARVIRDYGDVPPVEGNEARLGQVFLNLIVNAAHAIPEGDVMGNEIRLTTSTDSEGRAVVEVSDTGVGMTPDVLAHAFDAFFTTKPLGLGTGLGLTICRNLVTALGGHVEVRSEPDKGSTFRVVLPGKRSSIAPESDATPAPQLPRLRLLIVDDERAFAKALQFMLSNHDVRVVHSGREAIALCIEETFDCILCDLMMPDLTGMDVQERLSVLRPELASRLIFMTAGAFTARAVEFRDRSHATFLEKPFALEEVEAALWSLQDGKRDG